MNAFEQGARKMIPATLIYAKNKGKILMLQSKKTGRWNGLGGKCEADESFQEAAAREFAEEAGVKLPQESFQFQGNLHFPLFKADRGEDWMVQVFTVEGLALSSVQDGVDMGEGPLFWKTPEEVLKLRLWGGDVDFLPYVFREEKFTGTIWYRDGSPFKSEIRAIVGS